MIRSFGHCARPLALAAASVLLCATGCSKNPTGVIAPGTLVGTRILFTSNRDGNNEIYSMNPEGGGLTRLTTDLRNDGGPVNSPDGSRVLCVRDSGLWVMHADGTGQTALVLDAGQAVAFPRWSPDGRAVAFLNSNDWSLWSISADGSGRVQLASTGNGFIGVPSWSPDSKKLAYQEASVGSPIILKVVVIADTTKQVVGRMGTMTSLVYNRWRGSGRPDEAAWSPDGNWIAVNGIPDTSSSGDVEIILFPANGGSPRVVSHVGLDLGPRWSPDGNRIAWWSNPTHEVLIASVSGGSPVVVSGADPAYSDPVWSPDGKYLAYAGISGRMVVRDPAKLSSSLLQPGGTENLPGSWGPTPFPLIGLR